jgi:PTH2 family peptidyl-tRNA hydrolase
MDMIEPGEKLTFEEVAEIFGNSLPFAAIPIIQDETITTPNELRAKLIAFRDAHALDVPKQVILIRHDLKMRFGKGAAQAAHASMGWLLGLLRNADYTTRQRYLNEGLTGLLPDVVLRWIENGTAKIGLRVNSLDELLDLAYKARDAGLPVEIVTDAGRTEFDNQPTITCCAIGPASTIAIDKITGHLKLM